MKRRRSGAPSAGFECRPAGRSAIPPWAGAPSLPDWRRCCRRLPGPTRTSGCGCPGGRSIRRPGSERSILRRPADPSPATSPGTSSTRSSTGRAARLRHSPPTSRRSSARPSSASGPVGSASRSVSCSKSPGPIRRQPGRCSERSSSAPHRSATASRPSIGSSARARSRRLVGSGSAIGRWRSSGICPTRPLKPPGCPGSGPWRRQLRSSDPVPP